MFGVIGFPTLFLRIIGFILIVLAMCAILASLAVEDSPGKKFIDVYVKIVSVVIWVVFLFAVLCLGWVLLVEPTMITG